MELEEAASRLQVLLNFHQGLLKLAEVVDAARTAANLQKERDALAEKARLNLDKATRDLVAFQAEAEGVKAQIGATLKEASQSCDDSRKSMDARIASAAEKLTLVESQLKNRELELNNLVENQTNDFIRGMRNKQAEAEAELDASITQLENRKAELEKQVAALNKTVDKIKALAANL